MIQLPSHLGGHLNITHIDLGAITFIKQRFNIKTLIDVGCGIGGMIDLSNKLNIQAIGIDGDYNQSNNSNIIIHDFTMGKLLLDRHFDLGWSVEFVEHVESQFIDNFMNLFVKCSYVCMTHAPKRKKGYHHVNCQNSLYWEDIFKQYGFVLDVDVTNEIRTKSTMKREFMRKTGMFFKNGRNELVEEVN